MIRYISDAALVTALCWVGYKVLLRRQTYFRLTRLLLLVCLGLSFVLPLITVPASMSLGDLHILPPVELKTTAVKASTVSPHESASNRRADKPGSVVSNRANLLNWLLALYWFGAAALAFNFFLQLAWLFRQTRRNLVIEDGIFRIVELNTDQAPSSFARYIFINPAKYEWETYNQILLHEKEHIKGLHTLDMILAELMLIFQWFNPFAWLYRNAMKTNLEFLTDDTLIHLHKVDAAVYQLNLLQVSVPEYEMRLATSFNQSILKSRILMMDSKRSNIHSVWKYFMLFPALAVLICIINPAENAVPAPYHAVANLSANHSPAAATVAKPVQQAPRDPAKSTYRARAKHADTLKADSGTHEFEELNEMHSRGIPLPYTKELNQFLGRKLPVKEIIALYSRGITTVYVGEIVAAGYPKITTLDIIGLHDRGIKPEYLQGYADNGYPHLSMQDILALYSRAIPPEYVGGFIKKGYKHLTISEIISLHSRGIEP